MATVHDVAAYILQKQGRVTAMKLQKLVYYAQAWHLVWDERALFAEEIQAWANGPVTRELYDAHRGMYEVASLTKGNPEALDAREKSTVDSVLKYYGDKPSQWLSDLTHLEAPWREARRRAGAMVGQRCSEVITLADMMEYYSGLVADG